MRTEALHVGMKVRHPQAGLGVVRSVAEQVAEVRFSDGTRRICPETSGLEPAEPFATLTGSDVPLRQLLEEVVTATVARLGIEIPGDIAEELAARWHKGRMVLHPADPTLQTKEVELETFFHKIVMMRNNLRVLEQKIKLSIGRIVACLR
jgi:hypothetical protein